MQEYAVRAVFHTCGPGVLEDESYVTFMNGFGPDTHVRPSCLCVALSRSFLLAAYNIFSRASA